MNINNIPTPALIVDKAIFDRNAKKMSELLSSSSLSLRPHYKSHKCPAIARLQMQHGAAGITCAKLGEALDLCEAGISNIVIANQIVQQEKLPVLAALSTRCRLTVCADHAENVLALERAVAEVDGKLHVLVEYDVGMGRCGVSTAREVLALGKRIEAQPHLVFEGIQAYAGHLSHEEVYKIVPEAAKYLADRDIEQIAKTTEFNNRPDVICVSGITAGADTDTDILGRVKKTCPNTPVFANTGCKVTTIEKILSIADGAVVGTTFKKDGNFNTHVELDRVKEFMDKVHSIR